MSQKSYPKIDRDYSIHFCSPFFCSIRMAFPLSSEVLGVSVVSSLGQSFPILCLGDKKGNFFHFSSSILGRLFLLFPIILLLVFPAAFPSQQPHISFPLNQETPEWSKFLSYYRMIDSCSFSLTHNLQVPLSACSVGTSPRGTSCLPHLIYSPVNS